MTVPAAAASAVYPLIAGPPSIGVVLGSFSQALIVRVTTPDGPRVLSVLGPSAAGVPNGVRVPRDAVDFARHRPGDPARIGDRRVVTAGLQLQVVRTWNSRVHRITPGLPWIEETAAKTERGVPIEAISNLDEALAADTGAIGPAVNALVGLRATGQQTLARTIADHALDRIDERTTLLSADLLRLAAAGHACVEVLELLRAVHTGCRVPAALDRLLSVGHTSGADLATGLGMGLRCGRNMSQYDEVSTTTR